MDLLNSQSNVRFYLVSLEVIWMTGVSDAPRFAYSTKLGEDRHMLEGRATIQTLIGWNTMWTRTVWALDKDTVLHLGWNNPSTSAVWGLTLANFSFFSSAERHWDSSRSKPNESAKHPGSSKTKLVHGLHQQEFTQQNKGFNYATLLSTFKTMLGMLYQFWSFQFKRHWETGKSSEGGQNDDQRIKEPDTGKKVLFYSAWVRSFIGKDLITAFQYLRESYRRNEDVAFPKDLWWQDKSQ